MNQKDPFRSLGSLFCVNHELMKAILCLCLALLMSSNAFAIFCPTNFNAVNFGDTMEQVIQSCGEPVSRRVVKKTAETPQEWIYYFSNNSFDQSNTKLDIVFNANNQAINIEIVNNGLIKTVCQPAALLANSALMANNCTAIQGPQNVGQTNICGTTIQVGDSKEAVAAACGQPAFVNQSQQPQADNSSEIMEFIYGGSTPASLYFIDGVLVDRGTP